MVLIVVPFHYNNDNVHEGLKETMCCVVISETKVYTISLEGQKCENMQALNYLCAYKHYPSISDIS